MHSCMNIISQGAEAIVYRAAERVIKERPAKSYRAEQIDLPLRKSRTRREAKVLEKLAQLGIPAPRILNVDEKNMTIEKTYLDGSRVRDGITQQPDLARQIVTLIARMHNNHIIHGDLATPNMILINKSVHIIDFGLSFFSQKI